MASQIGGGSLLIAWQLAGKKVLIVGGGEVASQRVNSLLTTDVHITIISPVSGLHPRTRKFLTDHPTRIFFYDKAYEYDPDDMELLKYDMVLTALDDFELSRSICQYCRDHRIPVNAADIPELCDFYFGSQIRDGPLQIMVSTNGNGPRLANLVKGKIAQALTGSEGAAIKKVGLLRARLRERALGVGGPLGQRRMAWMARLCNEWTMEHLAALNEQRIRRLLDEGWERDKVPSPPALGIRIPKKSPWLMPLTIGFTTGVVCAMTLNVWLRRK